MKNFLIATVLLCTIAFKQDEPLSKIANISVPGNAVRMRKADGLTYAKNHFRNTIGMSNFDHILRIENNIVGFKDYDTKGTDIISLEDKRKELIGVLGESRKKPSYIRSDIVTVNHTRYLIAGAAFGDEGTITVTSEPKGSKVIGFRVQFKIENVEKANQLITDILNKISFKAASLNPEQ